ncbi:MAG: hypothetical protein ABIQ98_07830 [Sphingomicrobium sp.]
MKILIALAVGMLATGALAQSTTTTTTTNSMAPSMMNHSTVNRQTGSVVHNSTSTTARRTGSVTHTEMRGHHRMTNHSRRKCYNQMRNGHKVRVCRSRY